MTALPAGTHAVTATATDPRGVEWTRTIVWSDRALCCCPDCHEPLGTDMTDDPPAVIAWGAPDAPGAGLARMHGCGLVIDPPWLVVDTDDPDAVHAAAVELAELLTADIDAARAQARLDLHDALRAARAALAAPLADDETTAARHDDVLAPLHAERGVALDGGQLIAWAPDPAGRDEEGVYVRDAAP